MKKGNRVILIQRKVKTKKPSFWNRLFRFFFPKDWKAEFQKGKEIGAASRVARKIGGGMYDLGKATRKTVDPKHKMKIGKQKGTKK